MNDNDLDTMLREHGAAWRDGHGHRPAIDWAQVTESNRRRRAWLGLLAITATAAAVSLPLLLVPGSKPAAKPSPSTARPLPLKVAEQGAPEGFFGIAPPTVSGKGGSVAFVVKGGYEASNPPQQRAVAIGATADGYTAYGAFPNSDCTTNLEKFVLRLHYKGAGESMTNLDATTVQGVIARTAMAVSPDRTRLAYSTDRRLDPQTGGCVRSAPTIDVLNLQTKRVTAFTTWANDAVESLNWAPDSRHLAFELIPGGPNVSTVLTSEFSAYLIDTSVRHDAHVRPTEVVAPLRATRSGDGLNAPLLYLRGHLTEILDGAVRPVRADGKLGAPILTGLPAEVLSASVDQTGQHILMVAGPFATSAIGSRGAFDTPYSNSHQITTGTTYRWDRGLVTKVKDAWLDPAW